MDSIFFLGRDNDSLPTLLQKLGYSVIEPTEQISLPDFVSNASLDLILIDGRVMGDVGELCSFFHSQQSTRSVPIVCISEADLEAVKNGEVASPVEVIKAPFTVGTLASRIAMMLRLRKLAGTDERQGSLAEINASLRDNNLRFKKN